MKSRQEQEWALKKTGVGAAGRAPVPGRSSAGLSALDSSLRAKGRELAIALPEREEAKKIKRLSSARSCVHLNLM